MKHTAWGLALALAALAAPAAPAQPTLYVSSTDNTVYRVEPGGSPVPPFATAPGIIFGMAVGPDNNLYIADFSTVSRVGPSGGTPTPFATGFEAPRGLAFGPGGFLYVANSVPNPNGQYWIRRVNPSGAVDVLFTDVRQPTALASSPGGSIYVLHSDGTVSSLGSGGVAPPFASGFTGQGELEVGPDGNLYAAGGSGIARVGPGGGAATPFATGFSTPLGLAFGPDGNLYVANRGNGTISRVGPGGGTATVYAATGIANPSHLASAIPEPSTFLLCGAAAALAGLRQALNGAG